MSAKNFEKSLKNILTDCLKNGKIIKLSEITESNKNRIADPKKIKKHKKVLDKIGKMC